MKQKSRGWIGLRNFIILVLVMVTVVIIHLITVWITRNELLFPIIGLIVIVAAWAWMKSRSNHREGTQPKST